MAEGRKTVMARPPARYLSSARQLASSCRRLFAQAGDCGEDSRCLVHNSPTQERKDYSSLSPRTDTLIQIDPPSSEMSYHDVVETQRQYFLSGAPGSLPHRKEKLRTLKKMIEENWEEMCEAVYKDLKRPVKTTYNLEIGNAIVEIDYMLSNLDEWAAPTKVGKTHLTMLDTPMVVKDPLGVVLIVSPWNYPVSMILLPLVPALAAGNTVIIKPSEVSANVAETMAKLIPKYFEPRYLTVINGAVPETTELLKERFDHILYTGCPPVAKIIMAAASKHLTPVTLELGGKCPVIVEDDADIETSAKRIAWGKWLNCGQTCLAPDYVMVSAKTKPRLIEGFRKAITEFYGADIKASKDYSRIIATRHFDRISALLDKSAGVRLFDGGERDRDDLFIPPTILDCAKDDAFMQDEIFGPVLPVLTVSGLSEAIDYIKAGEKPLAAYIFTRSEDKVRRMYTETSSGGMTVNDVIMHLTVDTLPFGGVGTSGMGRYRGKYGFDTFTHEKSVLKRGFFGESLLYARYPPSTDRKFNDLKMLTKSRYAMPKNLVAWLPAVPIILVSIFVGMVLQRYKTVLH